MNVSLACLICKKKDSVTTLPIVDNHAVPMCETCHAKSVSNASKAKKAKKTDLCNQCYCNKSKRTVLYRNAAIALLYAKLERAVQLIAEQQFEKASHRLHKLVAECPGLYAAHYNLACISSICGQPMDAIGFLEKAFLHGYQNFQNVRKDPDLELARKQAAFKPMVKQFEKKPRRASPEVLGQMLSLCDGCAEVLSSTSAEAEAKARQGGSKNVCAQCMRNKAVVKARLANGEVMKLCSECAQSIAPGGANDPASSGDYTAMASQILGGPPPVAARSPSGGPPPVAPRRQDDVQMSGQMPGLPEFDDDSESGDAPLPPDDASSGSEDGGPPPGPPDGIDSSEDEAQVPVKTPRRPVGAVAIMPGMDPARAAARRAHSARGPPRGGMRGPPQRSARRMAPGRGRGPPPVAGGPPPGAMGPRASLDHGRGPARQQAPPGQGGPLVQSSPPSNAPGAGLRGSRGVSDDQSLSMSAEKPATLQKSMTIPASMGSHVANLQALPAGWREFVDKKTGRPYYYAAATKETVWVRPTKPATSPEDAAPLPAGWKEYSDKKTGRPYFYCASTKETVWVRPGPEKAVGGAPANEASPKKVVQEEVVEPAVEKVAEKADETVAEPEPEEAAPCEPEADDVATAETVEMGPLPEGWAEYVDKSRGIPYYYHRATKKTVWIRPT